MEILNRDILCPLQLSGNQFSRVAQCCVPGGSKNFPHRKGNLMATHVTETTGANNPIAFARGRQSLEQSVWYSGWLLTSLATGQDTRGNMPQ